MKSIVTLDQEARRDRRIDTISIEIELEGNFYTTVDWSLGGFLIDRYDGRRRPGDEVTIGIKLKVGEKTYDHAARAGVVRFTADQGMLACKFLSLDAATISTLEGYMTGRLRRRKPGIAKAGQRKKTARRAR